jgi:hypothetical protein
VRRSYAAWVAAGRNSLVATIEGHRLLSIRLALKGLMLRPFVLPSWKNLAKSVLGRV